jgi:hypothetical protein
MNQSQAGQHQGMRTVTVDELRRWEDNGATWRTVEVSEERAVLELCTCYGEPVDTVEGDAPDLIEFVRSHRRD